MSFDTLLLILVGIPAWVLALFTLGLWLRSHARKRLGASHEDTVQMRPPGASPIEER